MSSRRLSLLIAGALCVAALPDRAGITLAQGRQQGPGRSLGSVTTRGDLIVVTLDENALGKANMFDLAKRTLVFTPVTPKLPSEGGPVAPKPAGEGGPVAPKPAGGGGVEAAGYRAENVALRWDAELGEPLTGGQGSQVTLRNFTFPFSGKNWEAVNIGGIGWIGFGANVTLDRFAQLQTAARTLGNTVPAIAVFLKMRMNGQRFVKELADRLVVTWSLTEPVGGIQDFTWVPTVNRFQAVLHKDGKIELSYEQLAAKDAIVGIYPTLAPGAQRTEVDLSSVKREDGPFASVYESFHYLSLPNARDLTCTVIKALGDKFDFLAYYSDFRVDNQEAGTPSTGPRGGGPDGGAVTGIGGNQGTLANYCSQGRFQWQFIQPVYSGSNQMMEYPPAGVVDTNSHNVATYTQQLAERTSDGRVPPYNYGLSQIAHEMGHRWSAFVSARVNAETIPLGPTHWARGLQAPVPFPFQRPSEASAMGGGFWQDNFDGTFTQLDDDYYVPATGWSYLDLYLMGLIASSEVPDFFILRNMVAAGRDSNGHPIFKADRVKITVQDVIAVHGPRLPDVNHAQKKFNTGIVVMVEHSKTPSKELIERANGIRERWIDYWTTTTGHRSSMTTSVR